MTQVQQPHDVPASKPNVPEVQQPHDVSPSKTNVVQIQQPHNVSPSKTNVAQVQQPHNVSPSKTNVAQVQQPTPTVSLPRDWDTLKKGLTENQLVERLQKKTSWIKANTLRQWAAQGELTDITRTHDPDKLGWKLVHRLYMPLRP